jgi:hypothetical protein
MHETRSSGVSSGVGCLLGCVLTGFLATQAQASGEVSYHDDVSGTFFGNSIDVNGDGQPGTTGQLRGKSSFGPVDVTFYTEFDASHAGPSDRCELEEVELPLVFSRTVHRYLNGDLLYLET